MDTDPRTGSGDRDVAFAKRRHPVFELLLVGDRRSARVDVAEAVRPRRRQPDRRIERENSDGAAPKTGLTDGLRGYSTDMARVVVVATASPEQDALADHLDPTDDVVVVAPAVEQSRLDWLANDESDARATARAVGETVAAEAPAEASAVEVKLDPLLQVVRDAVAEHDPDRIVAVVRRGEDATWLEDGDSIPDAIDGVPVTLVEVDT